jgi:hypothetical protein
MKTDTSLELKKSKELLMDKSNIEDLIYTLSHYEIHIIVTALYNAVKIMDLMDPNKSFNIDNDMLAKQNKYDLISMVLSLTDQARMINQEIEISTGQKYSSHIN